MNMRYRKRLGDLLVEANVISAEQLQQALEIQKTSGKKLGKILVDSKFTTEEDIISALGFQLGLNRLYLYRTNPDKTLLGKVPESLVRRHEVFPVEIRGGKALIAMCDPLNLAAIQDLEMSLGMEVEPFLVASSVTGVMAQRLVRRICPYCREEYEVPDGAQERFYLKVPDGEPLRLKRGKGCAQCGFTGYKGRLAIHELMVMDSELRCLILEKASSDIIRAKAIENGMDTLNYDGIYKVRKGLTTVQEVLRVSFEEEAR